LRRRTVGAIKISTPQGQELCQTMIAIGAAGTKVEAEQHKTCPEVQYLGVAPLWRPDNGLATVKIIVLPCIRKCAEFPLPFWAWQHGLMKLFCPYSKLKTPSFWLHLFQEATFHSNSDVYHEARHSVTDLPHSNHSKTISGMP
jgi:hypothetical protein